MDRAPDSRTTDHVDAPRRSGDTFVRVGRAAILLVLAASLGYVSLGLLLLASVGLTGCFMSCTEPHYVGGALAAAGLALSLAAMVTAAAAAFVRFAVVPFARRTLLITGTVVAIGSLLVVANP